MSDNQVEQQQTEINQVNTETKAKESNSDVQQIDRKVIEDLYNFSEKQQKFEEKMTAFMESMQSRETKPSEASPTLKNAEQAVTDGQPITTKVEKEALPQEFESMLQSERKAMRKIQRDLEKTQEALRAKERAEARARVEDEILGIARSKNVDSGMERYLIMDVMAHYDDDSGKTIFKNSDGTPRRSPHDLSNLMSTDEFVSELLTKNKHFTLMTERKKIESQQARNEFDDQYGINSNDVDSRQLNEDGIAKAFTFGQLAKKGTKYFRNNR